MVPTISWPSPPRFLTGCLPFQMCSSDPQTFARETSISIVPGSGSGRGYSA